MASMTAETEKLLRKREQELSQGNQTTMDSILKPLKESISAMEKAMKDNAVSHLKSTTELSEQLKQAVKDAIWESRIPSDHDSAYAFMMQEAERMGLIRP